MSGLGHRLDSGLTRALRKLAWCEFELIEQCQQAAADADDEARALLWHQASAAQVRLFDVDSALRELGEEPVRYSRCIRQAMLSSSRLGSVHERLAQAYRRLLARTDLCHRCAACCS